MEKINDVAIEDELQSSYIDYAMSVIVGRAIPDARDGLKPVQRRILYAMYNIGNTHDKPTKKSARVVGECFVKDTLILTDKGLIPIQNVEKSYKAYTQDGLHDVLELYEMPKRKLIRIKLDNGTENIVTSSQQFKILTKNWEIIWKDAKDLKQGDYVLTRSVYPEITNEVKLGSKTLNQNIAYLLGQLLSDGFILHDNERNKYHRIGFCSSSIDVINAINFCLDKEFDYISHIEEKAIEIPYANGQIMLSKIYQLRVNKSTINKFFIETFNLLGAKAWSKRIPNQIFKSPRDVIFSFISGLIDGDGHIHNHRNIIEYATTSEQIANTLLILLQHLGIHGQKYTVKSKESGYILGKEVHLHQAFSLEFSGINAQLLAANLRLKKIKRKERVEELLHKPLGTSSFDILPWGNEKIFTELSKNHRGGGWYVDRDGKKFRYGIKYKTGAKIRYSSDLLEQPLHMSQIISWGILDKLKKISSKLAPFIEAIIKDNIFFSSIAAIEDAGEEVTYDIQVDNKHELIANGMVAHNCLGKYHPHGDVAIYDSLVRMAQTFSMNYLLVEGQGNMGSIDGDPPAAQRYTEVRMTKIAEEMLEDLDKETVGFIPNFDNTEKEPLVLPANLPNLLLNGSSGIAVGVATSIPPHNLSEVCDGIVHMLSAPGVTAEEMLEIIKGPDFPTGGIAEISENTKNGYKYGRGQVTVKAKTEIHEDKNQIIVTEIPYNVNKSDLIQNIARLVREKRITGITDLRDESDKEGIRIMIKLNNNASGEQVLNSLFMHTQLQVTFPIINLAVVGNSLKTFNILQFITTFLEYRRETIRKRSEFELRIATDRKHIVDGLLKAITNIDKVVSTIKESKDVSSARSSLMASFELSEKQANAILDMKLSRLTGLETTTLEKEKKDLEERIIYYSGILASPDKIDGLIRDETIELKKKYGRPRRTQIVISEGEISDMNIEDTITDEKITVILTKSGYVKRMNMSNYKEQARGGRGVISINLKEGDYVKQIVACNNKDFLVCISNTGKAYWLKAYNVPEGGRYAEGKAIVNLLNINEEKIVMLLNIKDFEKSNIAFLTAKGIVKKTDALLFSRPRSNGIRAITLSEGDEIIDAIIYTNEKYLVIITRNGKAIKFSVDDIRLLGRNAMGVIGIRLTGDDEARNIIASGENGMVFTVTGKGYGKLTDVNKYRTQARGGHGVINMKISDKTAHVTKALFVTNEINALLINSSGVSITFPIASIRITGRAASGVRLMRIEDNVRVVDARLMNDEQA